MTFIFNIVLILFFNFFRLFLLAIHIVHQIVEQFKRIFRVHHIEHFLAAPFVNHKVACFERFEMLGHRRLGQLDDARQFIHGLASLEQGLDDPVPRGVSDTFAEFVYCIRA
jgi:hypothetical protein